LSGSIQMGPNDVSFNIGSGLSYGIDYATVNAIAQQPDGKIIVGGTFNDYNGALVTNLIRINADGSIDTSFTNGNPIILN